MVQIAPDLCITTIVVALLRTSGKPPRRAVLLVVEWGLFWTSGLLFIESEDTMTDGILFATIIANPITYVAVALIAFLLFGNRLPSVMRSLGRSVVEFKKGVAGIEDDIEDAVRSADERVKPKKEDLEA